MNEANEGAVPEPALGAGDAHGEPSTDRHALREVSRAMVQIYKDQFGRGPTLVHSHYAGPDALVCFLEDSFTPVERRLQQLGEYDRLHDIRLFFQHTEKERFTGAIERITGRRVRAFISGTDPHADVSSEIFLLEPKEDDAQSST